MSHRFVLPALVCALALCVSGVANAVPAVFTVYGTQTTQSLLVDGNGNGGPDPGDVLLVGGPLRDGLGRPIGPWQAQVRFVDSETAQVLASFHFWSGTLLVKGSFNPSAGPPPSLDVYAGFGSFRAWEGTLALTNGAPGVNVFTFRLRHGTP